MHPRRICVVTGSRAEYGLLRGLLQRLRDNPAIEMSLIVTAAHLQSEFGLTVSEIEADKMPIAARVQLPLDGDTPLAAAKALGQGTGAMAEAIHQLSPDVVVVLGDRIELIAVASSCLLLGVPLAHIHGGEITEGAIDDAIRHAITKMAHLHFPVADAYRNRILQMGEIPGHVFVTAAPGLDNINEQPTATREQLERDLGLALKEPILAVTCHPETASGTPLTAAEAMLEALSAFPQATIVLTKANADPGGAAINQMIEQWAEGRSNARVVASLGMQRYHSLLHIASAIVGNSSSGVIEAPALGLPTVNIGDRQKGRLRSASIIDCTASPQAIKAAITRALSPAFRAQAKTAKPPYGRGGAADAIHRVLTTCDLAGLLKKSFVDQPDGKGLTMLQDDKVFVIAEAGVNHNGDLARAIALVDAAADAKADAVKFQTFRADALVTVAAPKAAYQIRQTGSDETQHAMLRKLELGHAAHRALADHCKKRGIQFLSTPFDEQSLKFLAEEIGLKVIKIGSGDLTNAPLLVDAARRDLKVILSTGMSTIEDVAGALGALAFGYAKKRNEISGSAEIANALSKHSSALADRVVLLHCTTDYPTDPNDVNLRAMQTLREHFGLPVGYSDHTEGLAVPLAAVALGACVIEKHFTMDRSLPGPDHKASLEPGELKALVDGIRAVERARGDGKKRPQAAELTNRDVARKSIVAARQISKGAPLAADDLCVKRPGTGIPPVRLWDLIGKRADRTYSKDEQIDSCLLT